MPNVEFITGASGLTAGPGYPLQFLDRPAVGLRDFRFYPLRVLAAGSLCFKIRSSACYIVLDTKRFITVCTMILSGFLSTVKIPPHKRGPWLFVHYGKLVYTSIGAAGINNEIIFGTVVMIPGFTGSPDVIKYPAYLEFSLRGDGG
jgi:hypothetical protein